ncbi:MAG: glycosyltransferase family 4 protein [Vicinamibacterales bacterium]
MPSPDIVYVLPDKLGGVFNFCGNLLGHRARGGLAHRAVVTHNRHSVDVRSGERLPADSQATVEYELPIENVYAVLRRVREAIDGTGALVANDWVELGAVSAYPVDRTVFSIVHGDFEYYYDLARKHEPEVDAWVTYSEAIYARLLDTLPHRAATIFLRRYGVEIGASRRPASGPLRLLYAGRIDRNKGVFDLPHIDAALGDAGVHVTWTVQGTGPDERDLKAAWPNPAVRWTGRQAMAQVLAEYTRHDVLVMPSRGEGLPVALLEAGAAGVVPVASDLASGVPEIVRNGETGFRARVGDPAAFASAIAAIAADRPRLEQMSGAIRVLVARDWDIRTRALEYEALFGRWRELRRPRTGKRERQYGSRLDRRWIPNGIVRTVRRFTHRTRLRAGLGEGSAR